MEGLAWRALEQWNLTVDHMSPAGSGENTVFLLHGSTGPAHVLRIHRPGYHTPAELRSEVEWMTALHDAGISVPRPVRTLHGATHAEVLLPGADLDAPATTIRSRQVGIIEWLPGKMLGEVIEDAAAPADILNGFRSLGQLIARMHTQAENWQQPETFTRPVLDAEALMGDSPHWGSFWTMPLLDPDEKALFLRAKARLREELRVLDRSQGFSLIHADLHAWNVLMEGDRISVIDFDDAAFGWHAFDLAVALYPFIEDPRLTDFRTAITEGYRLSHDLPPEREKQIDLFLVVRSLMVLGWMWARPDIQPEQRLPARIRIAVRCVNAWLSETR
ncbi:MAG: hypothetical protein FJ194_02275 [Gammaproteobacteria bacterium]|nr:hypothetical protein [Gammaproteobacteria bacterium]